MYEHPVCTVHNVDDVKHGDGQDSGQEHGEHDEQYLRQGVHYHHKHLHGKIIIIIFRRLCHHHHHQEEHGEHDEQYSRQGVHNHHLHGTSTCRT